ncbi:hypothetical protein ASD06_06885 [Angustibacter sp. Root456]|nr:hypothetical protein ASD06_06885 [Angustibacter sp. Root456]
MSGSATFTMLASSTTMSWAIRTTPRMNPDEAATRPVGCGAGPGGVAGREARVWADTGAPGGSTMTT